MNYTLFPSSPMRLPDLSRASDLAQAQVGDVAKACELTITNPGAPARRTASISIASGENEYTRYGYRDLIEREGADQIISSTIRRGITPL